MTTLRDYYTREEIKAHMQGRVGKIPEAVLGIIGDLEVTEAAYNRLVESMRQILETARWYADNGDRLPHEVDHALCVEILDLAQRALDA